MNAIKMRKEDLVNYKLGCLLNEMGVKSWDFSNEENCKKIKEVEAQILDLINTLPKLK